MGADSLHGAQSKPTAAKKRLFLWALEGVFCYIKKSEPTGEKEVGVGQLGQLIRNWSSSLL
jgi:hypothetical protein